MARTKAASAGVCALLGIPTGAEGREALARAISVVERGEPAALAIVDVDEFDATNRLLGSDRADEVLKAVARRVVAAVREGIPVVRLGGDVFALALPGHEVEQALIA